MTNQMHETGMLEELTSQLRRRFQKQDLLAFLSGFGFTLLVHLYMFTNKFVNYDDVGGLYSDCEAGLSSGRWMLHPIKMVVGSFSSAWIGGVAMAVLMGVAVASVVRLFRIRRSIPILLLSLSMTAFPVLACNNSYMYCAVQYVAALALSAAAALFIHRDRWWSILIGIAMLAVSMGAYQAYFCFAAALLVTVLMVETAVGCDSEKPLRFIWKALRHVVSLGLGMVLYMVILRVLLKITGTVLTDYKGISTMGQISLGELIHRILLSYREFFPFYGSWIFHPVFAWISGAGLLASLIGLAVLMVHSRAWRRGWPIAFLVVLLAVLPLASNLVYVMSGEAVHMVMRYAMLMPLLLPVILVDRIPMPDGNQLRRGLATALVLVLLLVQTAFGWEFFELTNRAYFTMDMSYKNAYSYATRLCAKIELQPDFTPETPVAIIGTAKFPNSVPPPFGMMGILTGDGIINMYTRNDFFEHFLGVKYRYAYEEQIEKIRRTKFFKKMPCYPSSGSIAEYKGVIVVKFSD